ncbi:MAG: hypothetical protein CVU30_14955 [Betaproteobacteria bacterium HGW-Betaproteobacteria-3]|jgi:MFS family permease|nr:MAG: hypothetical protein CVU30_14955 [Betaproteobacteria bacterium HGW-Betaproteobacteria-3]
MKLNIVPARTGLQWVKLGIGTFFKQPLALSGLFFMYMAAASVLSLVPLVGVVVALAIVPAATLGLMAATREATQGNFPMPSILISAFRAGRQRLRAMLTLGLIYAVAGLLISLLTGWLAPLPEKPDPGQEAMFSVAYQQSVLVMLALYLPVSLLFWHAPALVHWHGVAPVKSLFFSIVACLRNTGAFVVYGLAWAGVFLLSGLAVTLLGSVLGNPQFIAVVMVPTALLLAAMFSASLYFTFRDCFATDDDTAA